MWNLSAQEYDGAARKWRDPEYFPARWLSLELTA
jgi:hypothetical protein